MKATDITPGHRYSIAVTITAGPRTPKMRATQHATVVAVERSTVMVEVTEPVCTNLDQLPDDISPGYAMANGLLRWEQRPVTRTIRAADVIELVRA